MARPLRIEYPGAFYHITARGIEKGNIFYDDKDRQEFLKILEKNVIRYKILIYSYVLMKNHYHFLVETPESGLNKFMHTFNTQYTVYFNLKHNRVGHFFQGRYKSIIVDKESYLLELSRYIHLNPVRAGITIYPEDFIWSSYRSLIGLEKGQTWLVKDWLKRFFSRTDGTTEYKSFVYDGIKKRIESPLKEVYAQIILGDSTFTEKIKEKIKNLKSNNEVPSFRELMKNNKKDLNEIIKIVINYYGIKDENDIIKNNVKVRNLVIYLIRKYTDKNLKEIGEYFKLGYTAVSKIVRRVELNIERKEEIKTQIERLEGILANVKT